MIRIKTIIGSNRVLTLLHNGWWVTISTGMLAKDAHDIYQAGLNHLEACKLFVNRIVNIHTEHCCKLHGCKYGDIDCQVVAAKLLATQGCDECIEGKFL